MNKKSLFPLLYALCIVFSLFSAEVNVEKARLVAKNFYFEKANFYFKKIAPDDISFNQDFIKTTNGKNDYYVFTLEGNGFIIVSAEDVLKPVIGYSFESPYHDSDQPDSYRNFIQTYRDAIAFIRDNNTEQPGDVKALWDYYSDPEFIMQEGVKDPKSVSPLLQCTWNQSFPYNILCPEDPGGSGGHVYAGCVATAMAQVMYYWRYPLQGIGSHSYYYYPYGTLSANFGITSYQWEGMQNAIDGKNPEPIAELQYHCGVAVDMMYGPDGSGAYSNDVPPAMINYFGYSSDCYFTWKENYSNQVWENMLKENLDNSWPMYYSGFSNAGGHAFVCDGYQDNYFHFNFGWGGSQDGYYTLLTVNGFNDGQGAVLDTYPGSNYPYNFTGEHVLTYRSGSITDGSGPVENYENNMNCSWLIDPQTSEDSVSNIKIFFRSFETENNDVLTVYDGASMQDDVLGVFYGNTLPSSLVSTGNKVLIVFTSDGSGTAKGWLVEYAAFVPDYCKGLVTFEEPTGSFSDGSVNFNYHNGVVCLWKIVPPQAQSVTINFTAFDTEPGSDRVRVYDYESQELLAEYSGHYSSGNLPAPITAPSGKMFVAFLTNGSITASGWQADYSISTGMNDLADEQGEFHVFPNPASDEISISFSGKPDGNLSLKLISASGFLLMEQRLVPDEIQGNHTIDIRSLSGGIYFLYITDNSRSEIKKIIVR